MKTVRIVNRDSAEQIAALRIECYSNAREFRLLQPECLIWNELDDKGVVLAAFDSEEPVSTTRGLLVFSARDAEDVMGCEVDLPSSEFPALILGRGATRPDAARMGLHSVLRYYFIGSIIGSPIQSMLGMVYSGAPRTHLMQQIGYTLRKAPRVWDPEVEALQDVLVGHLPAAAFHSARTVLETLVDPALREYAWVGEEINWSARVST
jgi:hypothetical protein